MTRQQAWEVIWRLSIGSIPKLRRGSLQILLQEAARSSQPPPESAQVDFRSMYDELDRPAGKGWLMTAEVANRLGHPVQTVLRSLQDMAAHGLVQQWQKPRAAGEEKSRTLPYDWRLSEQGRKWAKQIGWLIEEEIGGDAA
jgi:hypothetical protein